MTWFKRRAAIDGAYAQAAELLHTAEELLHPEDVGGVDAKTRDRAAGLVNVAVGWVAWAKARQGS